MTNIDISGNHSLEDGGGIFINSYSEVTMTNASITGNRAGSFGDGDGGGVFLRNTKFTMINNTISICSSISCIIIIMECMLFYPSPRWKTRINIRNTLMI